MVPQALARMQKLHPGMDPKAIFSELGSDWLFRIPTIQVAAQHAALTSSTASGSIPASSSNAPQQAQNESHAPHGPSGPDQQANASLQAAHAPPAGREGVSGPQTHCFEFAAADPDRPGQPVFHSAELPFTFGSLDAMHQGSFRLAPERSPVVEELSERMQNAWVSFCQSGDPKWACLGWEASSPVQRVWSLPDQQGQHQRPPMDTQRQVWDGLNPDPLDIPNVKA